MKTMHHFKKATISAELKNHRWFSSVILAALFMLAAIGATFTGCSKSAATYEVSIPNTASFVLSLQPRQMMDKMKFEDMKGSELFKLMIEDTEAENPSAGQLMKELLNDPASAGVDLASKIFMFTFSSGTSNYVALLGKTTDKVKFEAILEKAKLKEQKQEKGSYVYIAKDHGIVGYNDASVMVVTDVEGEGKDLPAILDTLMNLPSDKKLKTEGKFDEFLSGKSDISFWVNTKELLAKAGSVQDFSSVPVLSSFLAGGYSQTVVDFENGEIVAKTKMIVEDKESGKELKIFSEGFDKALIEYLPAEKPILLLGMSLDMKAILSSDGMKQNIRSMAMGLGLTPEEFESMLEGDIVLEVEESSKVSDSTQAFVLPNIAIGLGIANVDVFKKVFDLIGSSFEKRNDYYVIQDPTLSEVFIGFKEKQLYVSNNEGFITAFMAGKKGKTSPEKESFAKLSETNSVFMSIKITSLIPLVQGLFGADNEDPETKMTLNALKELDLFVMSGGQKESEAKLTMTNKKENSLYTLMQMFNGLALMQKK